MRVFIKSGGLLAGLALVLTATLRISAVVAGEQPRAPILIPNVQEPKEMRGAPFPMNNTVTARETFAAAESFVAYGLLLSLVWVRLGSVDVALAEAAIGGGLGGVLLLGAAARLRAAEAAVAAERQGTVLRLAAAMGLPAFAGWRCFGKFAISTEIRGLGQSIDCDLRGC